MIKLLAMVCSLFAASCGTSPKDIILRHIEEDPGHPTDTNIDPEFQTYVNRFEKYLGKKVNIRIQFAPQEDQIAGVCIVWSDGYRQIEIDPDYWDDEDSIRDELIFHELGHCILNLEHDETLIDRDEYKQIPKSIMYPYTFGNTNYYKKYVDYYHNELFTRK